MAAWHETNRPRRELRNGDVFSVAVRFLGQARRPASAALTAPLPARDYEAGRWTLGTAPEPQEPRQARRTAAP